MKKTITILSLLIAFCNLANAQYQSFSWDVVCDEGYDMNMVIEGETGLLYVENSGSPYLDIDFFVSTDDFYDEYLNGYLCIEILLEVSINGVSDYKMLGYHNDDPRLTMYINGTYDLPAGNDINDLDYMVVHIVNMSGKGFHVVYW